MWDVGTQATEVLEEGARGWTVAASGRSTSVLPEGRPGSRRLPEALLCFLPLASGLWPWCPLHLPLLSLCPALTSQACPPVLARPCSSHSRRRPWASHTSSPSLNFLIHRMGVLVPAVPSLQPRVLHAARRS